MSGVALRTTALLKHFGAVHALQGVDLEIPCGSLYALVGANGAGKTTFFSVVAGFLRASGGEVEVLGVRQPRCGDLRRRLGMLPQDANFLAGVPVLEQLIFLAQLQGMTAQAARRAALAVLDAVGLGEVAERNPHALSHGMLKRVALCQAFLGDPELVFLDEPTAGLDPETARRVRELVRAWRGQRTVVISSHNLAELQDLCSHVAILHQGRVVSAGTMDAVLNTGCLLRCVLDSTPAPELLALLRALPSLARVSASGHELMIEVRTGATRRDATHEVLHCLLQQGQPPRTFHEGASLERRFLEAVGGSSDGLGSS